ncbi:MAG: 16S rRNA (cytidine(1402)-2'-O)-methyltransferase [Lentisphaerae bacterium]|jgi:16S rRNA (cytidine1402-2'-O)-methyltransferase|nr:16S rRNA (cytidine(1402)-2'-O)-methyltransferase [Lentisphaerota bacterium]
MGCLFIIATPIGNLQDMTPRAMTTLRELDVLACEDTRHTGQLLTLLDIPRPPVVVSNHEHNERHMAAKIVSWLDEGKKVGICSDAGYPVISDPGYPAVVAAIAAGHDVVAIPGASAVPLALISSGLPSSSYTFKGFPPRKPGRRRSFLAMDSELPHTLVFYESPFRIGKLLADALEVYGDRQAAVCMELTKQFERVHRGSLAALAAEFADRKVKGEAVIVIAGNNPKFTASHEDDEVEEEDADRQ